MACIHHLRNLKCEREVEARAILTETGEYQYSRKPATSFLQLDLMALIPDKAPANVAVGADGNCLYRCFLLGTKIAIKNYGFALFVSSCSITSVLEGTRAHKVSGKSGFSLPHNLLV